MLSDGALGAVLMLVKWRKQRRRCDFDSMYATYVRTLLTTNYLAHLNVRTVSRGSMFLFVRRCYISNLSATGETVEDMTNGILKLIPSRSGNVSNPLYSFWLLVHSLSTPGWFFSRLCVSPLLFRRLSTTE